MFVRAWLVVVVVVGRAYAIIAPNEDTAGVSVSVYIVGARAHHRSSPGAETVPADGYRRRTPARRSKGPRNRRTGPVVFVGPPGARRTYFDFQEFPPPPPSTDIGYDGLSLRN